MARILFALDLGAGYGHLTRILPVADWLAARGHETVLALRPGGAGAPMLAGRPHRIVDAPVWTGSAEGMPVAECYADLLLRTGYAEPGLLPRLLRAWLALYERQRPALIISEFAPTAMLAAQLSGRRHAVIGCGFTLPPRTSPMPRLRPWVEVSAARIAVSEARALGIINDALAGLGGRTLGALEQSLAADAGFLCSFPEFDHYGERPGTDYYGNVYLTGIGAPPAWPGPPDAPRAFAYMRATTPAFLPMLHALADRGLQTVLHTQPLPPGLATRLPAHGLAISRQPVRLDLALAACRVVVCYSPNTAAAALLAGRPVLLMPQHVEQAMAADRLARQGLARVLPIGADAAHCAEALRAVLDEPRYRAAAQRFATRYHGYDPADAAAAVGESCEDLLADTL
jgi:bacterioferritin-associated ferredoxin